MMAEGSMTRIWTPEPRRPWDSERSMPGVSSAGVPSMTRATSGLVREPRV